MGSVSPFESPFSSRIRVNHCSCHLRFMGLVDAESIGPRTMSSCLCFRHKGCNLLIFISFIFSPPTRTQVHNTRNTSSTCLDIFPTSLCTSPRVLQLRGTSLAQHRGIWAVLCDQYQAGTGYDEVPLVRLRPKVRAQQVHTIIIRFLIWYLRGGSLAQHPVVAVKCHALVSAAVILLVRQMYDTREKRASKDLRDFIYVPAGNNKDEDLISFFKSNSLRPVALGGWTDYVKSYTNLAKLIQEYQRVRAGLVPRNFLIH